ncbi:MAG: glycosyl hydrolase 53 family protein [Bacteroidales bacterium]|nr:glycosyl hydrolase 53 family protein [Bacteroidales bacterium]
MKKLAFLVAMFAFVSCGSKETPVDPDPGPDTPVTDSFVKGADISWASEMEAGGRTWKKKNGTAASLLDVLKDCGLNAVRLRVWVDPYKGWSGKEDVVTAAKKAYSAGMAILIDFHYSDFFADPGRQKIPAAWAADASDKDKMALHVSGHTREVLQALKSADVDVSWIQIGNETRNGMLSPAGDAVWKNDQIDLTKFVALYNAGYDAAKSVYPQAYVMPHLDNAYSSVSYSNPMWLADFKAKGGKFDMVAFSHYPQNESKIWINGKEKTLTPAEVNQYALDYIRSVIATYNVPVMVAEVGVKTLASETTARAYLQAFMDGARQIERCAGVFYWEPETDGTWRPEIYALPAELTKYTGTTQTSPWGAYDQGTFTTSGTPTSVLDCFAQ